MMLQALHLTMFRRIREKAFFADTQKFFPATAIYNAFRDNHFSTIRY